MSTVVEIPTHDADALRRLADPDHATSQAAHDWRAANWDRYLAGWEELEHALRTGTQKCFGSLYLSKMLADGTMIDLGLAGHRKVTTVGMERLVAAMNGTDATTLQNFKFHGIGTTNTAENIADTALAAELDNELNTANTRPTGSQGVGANNHVYRTSAICQLGTVGTTQNVVEHGVFSAATTGTGYLLDRTVFTAIPLDSGQAVNAQYDFTATPGS